MIAYETLIGSVHCICRSVRVQGLIDMYEKCVLGMSLAVGVLKGL